MFVFLQSIAYTIPVLVLMFAVWMWGVNTGKAEIYEKMCQMQNNHMDYLKEQAEMLVSSGPAVTLDPVQKTEYEPVPLAERDEIEHGILSRDVLPGVSTQGQWAHINRVLMAVQKSMHSSSATVSEVAGTSSYNALRNLVSKLDKQELNKYRVNEIRIDGAGYSLYSVGDPDSKLEESLSPMPDDQFICHAYSEHVFLETVNKLLTMRSE